MSNFGTNPNNVGMFVYKPKSLPAKPALVVALHYCTGTAQAYYQGTKYAQIAEQKGERLDQLRETGLNVRRLLRSVR